MTGVSRRIRRYVLLAFPVHTLNRDLKILFVANLFASFGDGLTIYLLPLFIRDIQATPENVGFLFSVLTVASAVTIIPGGFLADKYDRKKILLLGWAIWTPVPLVFAFATLWTQLIPAMFFYGVLISGPASSAYIVGCSDRSKMASTATMLAAAWGIGYTFAPSVSGLLAGTVGRQYVFFLTAIFYLITLVTLTQISSQRATPASTCPEDLVESRNGKFEKRNIFYLSVLFASVMFFLALIFALVPQFLGDVYNYDVAQIGVFGSFTYFGGSTLSLMVGRIGDKRGKTVSISVSMLLVAISLGIFVSTGNFFVLILASFLRGASFPTWALIGATVGPIVPSASRARWISVVQTTAQVTSILAPYVGGVLYVASPQTPFLLTIVAALIISFLAQTKPFKK